MIICKEDDEDVNLMNFSSADNPDSIFRAPGSEDLTNPVFIRHIFTQLIDWEMQRHIHEKGKIMTRNWLHSSRTLCEYKWTRRIGISEDRDRLMRKLGEIQKLMIKTCLTWEETSCKQKQITDPTPTEWQKRGLDVDMIEDELFMSFYDDVCDQTRKRKDQAIKWQIESVPAVGTTVVATTNTFAGTSVKIQISSYSWPVEINRWLRLGQERAIARNGDRKLSDTVQLFVTSDSSGSHWIRSASDQWRDKTLTITLKTISTRSEFRTVNPWL